MFESSLSRFSSECVFEVTVRWRATCLSSPYNAVCTPSSPQPQFLPPGIRFSSPVLCSHDWPSLLPLHLTPAPFVIGRTQGSIRGFLPRLELSFIGPCHDHTKSLTHAELPQLDKMQAGNALGGGTKGPSGAREGVFPCPFSFFCPSVCLSLSTLVHSCLRSTMTAGTAKVR